MSICFIDWFAYGLFNPQSKIVFGGAQIQLYFLAKELAKEKKYQVYFLTDNQKNSRIQTFFNIKVYQFVRFPKTPGILGQLLNLFYKIPTVSHIHFFSRLLRQLKKINAEIYVQRAASAETGLIALIAKLLRKKFIFMVAHERDVNGFFIRQNGWRGQLFLMGLKLADKIICQTSEQQNQLDKQLKNKSKVIASGYPIKSFEIKEEKKQGILWVARAEKWKRPDLFIQLAQKFPQERFTMICPPAENRQDYFQSIKSQAQRVSNLTFIEKVPFNKINNFFKAAKVFVSTSESEGFPNTFIQAAKNSTPVISFKIDPDQVIFKNQFGFCAQGSEQQLTKDLKRILTNQKLESKLAKNAYGYATSHHRLSETVAKFKSICLNLST